MTTITTIIYEESIFPNDILNLIINYLIEDIDDMIFSLTTVSKLWYKCIIENINTLPLKILFKFAAWIQFKLINKEEDIRNQWYSFLSKFTKLQIIDCNTSNVIGYHTIFAEMKYVIFDCIQNIENFKNLKKLKINSYYISYLPLLLQYIDLSDCNCDYDDIFSQCKQIQLLSLSNCNNISSNIFKYDFKNTLKSLHIESVDNKQLLDDINELENLERLTIYYYYDDYDYEEYHLFNVSFNKLKYLKHLQIVDPRVKFNNKTFEGLINIEYLEFSVDVDDEIDYNGLIILTKLKTLIITNCNEIEKGNLSFNIINQLSSHLIRMEYQYYITNTMLNNELKLIEKDLTGYSITYMNVNNAIIFENILYNEIIVIFKKK